jgi:MFS family permease
LNNETIERTAPLSATTIYAIIFITGIARGFGSPAISSITPQIVPRELYENASAWNSTMWEIGAISGPALGGFIFGFFGAAATYAVDTTLMICALFLMMLLKSRSPAEARQQKSLKESLLEGLKFVYKNELILSAITLDMFAVLFGGAVALLPIFASEILGAGAEGLGLLRAAPSVGALLTAVYLTRRSIGKNAGKKLLFSVAGFGACMILFGVSVIIRSVILQTQAPDDMRGRVASVNQIFINSSNELGSFESGIAAKLMGVVPSVVFGGLMTLGVVGATALKAKKLTGLNRIETA